MGGIGNGVLISIMDFLKKKHTLGGEEARGVDVLEFFVPHYPWNLSAGTLDWSEVGGEGN